MGLFYIDERLPASDDYSRYLLDILRSIVLESVPSSLAFLQVSIAYPFPPT